MMKNKFFCFNLAFVLAAVFAFAAQVSGSDRDDFSYATLTQAADSSSVPTSVPSQDPIADLKVNGQDGPITVSTFTPVSVTIGLAPGDKYGRKAVWWIVYTSSWGEYSLTADGWTRGVKALSVYPLIFLTPMEIMRGYLPAGDYVFHFFLEWAPAGILDSPYSYDGVQVHVIESISNSIITLTASPLSLKADGTSSSTITATIKDKNGLPVAVGTSVGFATNLSVFSNNYQNKYTTTTVDKKGTATASLLAGLTPGTATIICTSGYATAVMNIEIGSSTE
jgi:hypothetical protein